MKYVATIEVDKDASKLYDCLKLEDDKRDRSTVKINQEGEKLIINIEAKDATALRASFDGIIKLIITFEKMSRGEL